ncbi:hypothetical protein C8J56DRAFT_571023 [Mycena floridula]|nr:hypothetical protein C8J56DRAFT_571023 [Mycena floridula]
MKLQISANDLDLQTYITGRMMGDHSLKQLIKGDESLEKEVIEQVIMKASGKFLQAQLHLDSLASQLTCKDLRLALGTLPEIINNSYNDAIVRIDAQQGQHKRALAYQVFYWLVYTKKPLTVQELQHALAVSSDPDMIVMDWMLLWMLKS